MNSAMLWSSQLANFLAAPAVSPYDNPAADFALDHLRGLLTKSIDFSAFPAVATIWRRPNCCSAPST